MYMAVDKYKSRLYLIQCLHSYAVHGPSVRVNTSIYIAYTSASVSSVVMALYEFYYYYTDTKISVT